MTGKEKFYLLSETVGWNCSIYIDDFLLELLNACDKAEGLRKEKILKTAMAFSNWISEAPDEELDCQVKNLKTIEAYVVGVTMKRKKRRK